MSRSLCIFCIIIFVSIQVFAQKPSKIDHAPNTIDSLFNTYSLSELLTLNVVSTSLSDLKNNLTLTPVILINQEQISSSGARSLDELLEIFVPGFYYSTKGTSGHALGFRGIIGDRNNKVLLLVNGKVMNNRSICGAMSERLFSMLGDIERIEVIQSPQSSLYGPGAISAVINMYTKEAEKTATEIEVNQGAIDWFSNVQISHQKKISKDLNYHLYYGVDRARGISQEMAPAKLSFNSRDANGDTILSDQPISYPLSRLNSSDLYKLRHKIHAQIQHKNFTTWFRLTRGGINFDINQQHILERESAITDSTYMKYLQYTFHSEYKKTFGNYSVIAKAGFDQMHQNTVEISHPKLDGIRPSYKENEFSAKTILKYSGDKINFAIGPAISFEKFGMPAFGMSIKKYAIEGIQGLTGENYDPMAPDSVNIRALPWTTVMYSGLSEIQYAPAENITMFAGLRVDKHTYTETMLSPRAGFAWKSAENNLFRFQYSRSNRRADDQDLRLEFLGGNDKGSVEKIDFLEFSDELTLGKYLFITPTIYGGNHKIVSWVWQQNASRPFGTSKYYGAEFQVKYINSKNFFTLSHNYSKLLELSLYDISSTPTNNISSAPYGYGNDFSCFPRHLTKAYFQYSLNQQIKFYSSSQIIYGLKGAIEAADFNVQERDAQKHAAINTGSNKFAAPTVYWHAGLLTNFGEQLDISWHFYNLSSLLNGNLSKRIEFYRSSQYRVIPFSTSLKVAYRL